MNKRILNFVFFFITFCIATVFFSCSHTNEKSLYFYGSWKAELFDNKGNSMNPNDSVMTVKFNIFTQGKGKFYISGKGFEIYDSLNWQLDGNNFSMQSKSVNISSQWNVDLSHNGVIFFNSGSTQKVDKVTGVKQMIWEEIR